MKNPSGICYLTGAGPGDLGLVTLRARDVVGQAQVLVYDYLCNPGILEWAPPDAEIIYAGKKAGAHTLAQDEINALLVDRTRAGKRVVRLKGGDPFVFGRGGEEAEALAREKLAFEVIPGISSVFAGPAYAGIPVTHREHTSQVTIFTGHEDPAKPDAVLDYAALATQPGTRIMLMGVERIGPITKELLSHGADPALPVALIRWATTGRQQTLRGRLDDIAARVAEAGFSAPAVAVFGQVVKLRDTLNWFESRPLFGRRIVVTRTRKQAGALSGSLRGLGADVWEIPTIRIEEPADLLEFGQLVQDSHGYDWIIFTSPNGVDAFFKMFFKLYDDCRDIGAARIAAVGPATAARVREFHLKVELQPAEYVAEAIIKEFQKEGSVENLRILLARAEQARDILPSELTKLGAIVDVAIAYRTVPETADVAGGIERFRNEGADMVTFASSSAVENFLAMKLPLPGNLKTASIGPVTSKTMREMGLKVDVEAAKHDIPGLTDAIRKFYVGKRI
ncbi:MAG TPA: uroporphyrinogen-III C-methyltransferase [Chthoniobacteraceae bacterium]|jgi:uroporphyrinogen III methyltransferase/synthase|nr:uroporphyrinogen-III C-methyltransferase [Chthoniobacteraceae bacterium]